MEFTSLTFIILEKLLGFFMPKYMLCTCICNSFIPPHPQHAAHHASPHTAISKFEGTNYEWQLDDRKEIWDMKNFLIFIPK